MQLLAVALLILTLRFDGYGSARISAAGDASLVELHPKAAVASNETHAALVTSQDEYGDLDATVEMQTVAQNRTAPNPWEAAWLLWHFSDDDHFYYFIAKRNGWELGKRDPAYPGAQRFLATGDEPKFPVGPANLVRVTQRGGAIAVWVNGVRVVSYDDAQRPYLRGRVGLYCEDSDARFVPVAVSGR